MRPTAEILRGLPYFSDLPEDLLSEVCEDSEQVEVEQGTVIIEEGSDSEEMYVIVEGELLVTKRTGERDVVLARLGPSEVVGEMAFLDQAPRTATVTASMRSLLIRVPVTAFEELLQDPRVSRRMFKTVTSRLRNIEETLRHEERMAALGRMAAQLMHELNNPAAAVARSTAELARVNETLGTEAVMMAGALVSEGGFEPPEPPPPLSVLERADREDAVAAWLADLGVQDTWDLAPALVEVGWEPETLESATKEMPRDLARHFARWLGLRTTAEQMVGDLGIAANRISELVRIVKEYSYLDQAPVQELDLTEGINDTLILLKHKLRDIEVTTHFPEDLHPVEAPGRDLNQVWTNLIDNAAHAMEGRGELSIEARNEGDDVVVSISDTGPGIPVEQVDRIFDPFFTTKEPGEGTGLGLHTVHTIINRIGGEISVDTSPSGTTFAVRLPALG
jgi:signal transduction histidine kinase